MSDHYDEYSRPAQKRSLGCLSVVGLILLTIVITIGATLWAINSQWFTRDFKPVELSNSEEETLSRKLDAISDFDNSPVFDATPEQDKPEPSSVFVVEDINAESSDGMEPETYTEDDSKRRIELTERELNALLAGTPIWQNN